MKWMRRLAWAGGATIVLWALAWAAVPPVLKSQVQQRASEALGRSVTLGEVSFNPWSLELILRRSLAADLVVDIPNKPRNLVGLAKSLPAAEMEALLKSTIEVTPDAMRQLALQRGLAVRDALVAKGLPSERLFLAAPKVRAAADGAEVWLPSAKLSLTSD